MFTDFREAALKFQNRLLEVEWMKSHGAEANAKSLKRLQGYNVKELPVFAKSTAAGKLLRLSLSRQQEQAASSLATL